MYCILEKVKTICGSIFHEMGQLPLKQMSGKTICDLPVECLIDIFEHLSQIELISVACVGDSRLHAIAERLFARKYRNTVVHFPDEPTRFDDFENFFRAFGDTITHLRISRENLDSKSVKSLATFLSTYCINLEYLRLDNFRFTALNFHKHPLPIGALCLNNSTRLLPKSNKFNNICVDDKFFTGFPNLAEIRLSLRGVKNGRLPIIELPKLKSFSMSVVERICFHNLKVFLARNPQMESLELRCHELIGLNAQQFRVNNRMNFKQINFNWNQEVLNEYVSSESENLSHGTEEECIKKWKQQNIIFS